MPALRLSTISVSNETLDKLSDEWGGDYNVICELEDVAKARLQEMIAELKN